MTRIYSVVRAAIAAGDGIISEDDDGTEFPAVRGTPPVRITPLDAQRFELESILNFREVFMWAVLEGPDGIQAGDDIVENLDATTGERVYRVKYALPYPTRNDRETILRLIVEVVL